MKSAKVASRFKICAATPARERCVVATLTLPLKFVLLWVALAHHLHLNGRKWAMRSGLVGIRRVMKETPEVWFFLIESQDILMDRAF